MDDATLPDAIRHMEFKDGLKRRVAQLRISNAEAARRCDLSERRFGNYVTGARIPKLDTVVRIAKALGTSPNALLSFDLGEVAASGELVERISISASHLDQASLELLAVQVEALAERRRR